MKRTFILIVLYLVVLKAGAQSSKAVQDSAMARFQANTHTVVLDDQSKIIPWSSPKAGAYDRFLRDRWNFIKTMVPMSPGPAPRSSYPQYYFYCAYRYKGDTLQPDQWMNDVGEKIPNWFESARLYYAYTGDSSVMKIVRDFIDYSMDHGKSPSDYAWPDFPYTTTNAGDTLYRGFTSSKRFELHEVQVDHGSEMGLAWYRLYQYTGDKKYLDAARKVANTLASKVRTGSATQSPWPYIVNIKNGKVGSEYGANWSGAYLLLTELANAGIGKVEAYRVAAKKAKDFLLNFPMKTGYWTDGHSDVKITSNKYKSNLSASNLKLFMYDHPEFNPNWKRDIPMLIEWTEKYFVHRGDSSEPGTLWGANIVGEQDDFLFKMDYQTARYAAECAQWYAISGDKSYKEKAYRSLNLVTYCSDSNGMAFESPLSKDISNWWSDCYGEGPRMFYPALAAIPEWAPPGENHILYSKDVLKDVIYESAQVSYTATGKNGTETIRLNFKPESITLNNKKLVENAKSGYALKSLGDGDYVIRISRTNTGNIIIAGSK